MAPRHGRQASERPFVAALGPLGVVIRLIDVHQVPYADPGDPKNVLVRAAITRSAMAAQGPTWTPEYPSLKSK